MIRAVIGGMTLAATALLLPLTHKGAVSSDTRVSLWVVAGLFALAESFVVHVYVDRHARTFSLSEIPLLLGLAYLSPAALVGGRLLGSLIALTLVRRQPRLKVAFNLSHFVLESCLAIIVYRAILGPALPSDPRGWVAAFAATTTSLVIGLLAVSVVIAASEGRWLQSPLESLAGMGAVTTGISTYLGLLAVAELGPDRASPWLFLVAAVLIFAAYHAHARVRQSAVHLEQLYGFSKTIAASLDHGAVDFALLELTSDVLRAESAELIVANDDGAALISLRAGTVFVLNNDHALDMLTQRRAALDGRAVAFDENSMLAALHAGDEELGTLLVADRLGEVDRFNGDDLQLFEMLAAHASIALRNYRLVERLRLEADERHRQALHDALTGLPNRARLDDELLEALANRADDESVVVMLIDLDRFKEVNDTLGHHQGDILLCRIAERITDVVDQRTLVARLGGDEFAVVCTTTADRESIKAGAEAIEHRLLEPFELADLVFEVGCSVGIAVAPDDGTDPSTLLQRADVAMYAAKRGSASAEFYSAANDHASPKQLALAAELRRDITRRALLVEYQPKAELPSGDIVGVEALARWHHADHGFIAPEEFVRIAERSGLIRHLTELVLDVSLGQLAQWRAEGFDLVMAVNISTRNLLDDALPPIVESALARHGIPPSMLTLEITESTIIADPPRTVGTLNRLSDMGVALAIDDFGTGYSSLSYLHRLPVDEIKIDKSFVQRMTADESDSVIVRSTIDLGHNLGLQVTAEGVEDGQTWQFLSAAGCDQAQGFFLRQSGTGAQLSRWLKSSREEQAALRGLNEASDASQPSTSTT